MCRQQGYFDLTNIQTAIFEFNGRLTILPVSTQRPVTPSDMNLSPEQELPFTELVMDGRILESNLQRMGLNWTWLDKQLKQRGIQSAQNVLLALCDRNQKLLITPEELFDEFLDSVYAAEGCGSIAQDGSQRLPS
jgi:uncharacterized membrane protein YcaP (DUF421 family)